MSEESSIPEPGLPYFKYGMKCHQWTFYRTVPDRNNDAACCGNEVVLLGEIKITGEIDDVK